MRRFGVVCSRLLRELFRFWCLSTASHTSHSMFSVCLDFNSPGKIYFSSPWTQRQTSLRSDIINWKALTNETLFFHIHKCHVMLESQLRGYSPYCAYIEMWSNPALLPQSSKKLNSPLPHRDVWSRINSSILRDKVVLKRYWRCLIISEAAAQFIL